MQIFVSLWLVSSQDIQSFTMSCVQLDLASCRMLEYLQLVKTYERWQCFASLENNGVTMYGFASFWRNPEQIWGFQDAFQNFFFDHKTTCQHLFKKTKLKRQSERDGVLFYKKKKIENSTFQVKMKNCSLLKGLELHEGVSQALLQQQPWLWLSIYSEGNAERNKERDRGGRGLQSKCSQNEWKTSLFILERILGLYWLDWEASFYFQINNNIFIS